MALDTGSNCLEPPYQRYIQSSDIQQSHNRAQCSIDKRVFQRLQGIALI